MLAEKIIKFNSSLQFKGKLPKGIRIMNPFREEKFALQVSSAFYRKYYADTKQRHFILGINPGRFGAGLTGIPFTDPKRLVSRCQIAYEGIVAHEPSSAFIYEMIEAFGGEKKFYAKFYINSICPLGFTAQKSNGREVNYNYYDSLELTEAVYEFMVRSVKKQIAFGLNTETAFCFGTGKNEKFLRSVNEEYKFFDRFIPLEHPRYIMQYKAREKNAYIQKYLAAFAEV